VSTYIQRFGFPILFCFALSLLAVGLKNSEPGISLDGLLYASVSAQVATFNQYINLQSGAPIYEQFFEHPHMFFWIVGTWLKFFPHEDWAVRVPSHAALFVLLLSSYLFLRQKFSSFTASLFCLFTICLTSLTHWYSNVFIDGIFFTFAITSVLAALTRKSFLSGALLACAVMTKGATVLGVGPTFLVALVLPFWTRAAEWRQPAFAILRACLAFWGILFCYYALVAWGFGYGDFFTLYYERHFTNRFLPTLNILGGVSAKLWTPLIERSFYTVFLLLLAPWVKSKNARLAMVLIFVWIVSWAFMYGAANRFGGWYGIPFYIAIAFGVAIIATEFISKNHQNRLEIKLKHAPLVIFGLIAIVQYLPVKVRARVPPQSSFELRKMVQSQKCDAINIHFSCSKGNFRCSHLRWYTQTLIRSASSPIGNCHLAMLSDREKLPLTSSSGQPIGKYWFWKE
jgi:4-amino-4-deoxy-L-arabinose transferase-like glycosyltransferase